MLGVNKLNEMMRHLHLVHVQVLLPFRTAALPEQAWRGVRNRANALAMTYWRFYTRTEFMLLLREYFSHRYIHLHDYS